MPVIQANQETDVEGSWSESSLGKSIIPHLTKKEKGLRDMAQVIEHLPKVWDPLFNPKYYQKKKQIK
jgi:hypothetical protein